MPGCWWHLCCCHGNCVIGEFIPHAWLVPDLYLPGCKLTFLSCGFGRVFQVFLQIKPIFAIHGCPCPGRHLSPFVPMPACVHARPGWELWCNYYYSSFQQHLNSSKWDNWCSLVWQWQWLTGPLCNVRGMVKLPRVFICCSPRLLAASSSQLLAALYVNFPQACAVQWPFKAEIPLFLLCILIHVCYVLLILWPSLCDFFYK